MNRYERRLVAVPAWSDERQEDIVAALADDYEERGPRAIEELIEKSPARFVMAAAAMLNDERCPDSVRARLAATFRAAITEARKRRLM